MSLRNRVLLGFLAITFLLVATDVVIAVSVHRSLIDQLDRRISAAVVPLSSAGGFGGRFFHGGLGLSPSSGGQGTGSSTTSPSPTTTAPSTTGGSSTSGGTSTSPRFGSSGSTDNTATLTDLTIIFLNSQGVTLHNSPGLRDERSTPHLGLVQVSKEATAPHTPPRFFTVGAAGSSDVSYRVAAVRTQLRTPSGSTDGYLVVGVSLTETNATFSRLAAVAIASTAAVLVALALIAFWVIRLGVHPIDEMAATANAIAEGDLSRRVDVGPDSTEVGRLGLALNGMLHQIEGAFAQRQASENRLRQFVADASHELRTPLTSIRGYTELYRAGVIPAGPELDDAMRRIEGEAGRMGELVEDLLLLARLDQGRPLESEPVDLAALARDAVADARAVEPDRPIAIDTPAAPVVVSGDERHLRQVVGNLLANVRSHTPAGSAVDVRVRSGAGRALLEVADQGPGIPPELGDRVFERFFRGDPARVRDGAGAGLGLSIVAAVVQSHHGQAWVESEPGQGARFRVELPLTGFTENSQGVRIGS
jgi:signal transduction histidine kinase